MDFHHIGAGIEAKPPDGAQQRLTRMRMVRPPGEEVQQLELALEQPQCAALPPGFALDEVDFQLAEAHLCARRASARLAGARVAQCSHQRLAFVHPGADDVERACSQGLNARVGIVAHLPDEGVVGWVGGIRRAMAEPHLEIGLTERMNEAAETHVSRDAIFAGPDLDEAHGFPVAVRSTAFRLRRNVPQP
jgi:hypothetical protein